MKAPPPFIAIRAGVRGAAQQIGHMADLGRSIASDTKEALALAPKAAQSVGDLARMSSTRRVLNPARDSFNTPKVIVDTALREASAGVAANAPAGSVPNAIQQAAVGRGGANPGAIIQQLGNVVSQATAAASLPGGIAGAQAGLLPGLPGSGGIGPGGLGAGLPGAGGPAGQGTLPPGAGGGLLGGLGPIPGVARSILQPIGMGALHLGQIVTGTVIADVLSTVVRSPDVAQNIEYAIMRRGAQMGILGQGRVQITAENSSDPFETNFLGNYEEDKGIAALRATVNHVRRAYFLTGQEIEALWDALGEQASHWRHTLAGARIMRDLGLSVGQAGSYLRATNAYVGPPPVSRRTRRGQGAMSLASHFAGQLGAGFGLRTAAQWLPWSPTAGRPVVLETSMAFAQARGRPAEYLEDVSTYAQALASRAGTRIDERLALGAAALMNKPVAVRGVTTMLGGVSNRGLGLAAIQGAGATPDDAALGEKMRAIREFLPTLTIGEKDSAITYDARRSPRDARIIVESGDPRTWAAYAKMARADAKRLGFSRDWARSKFGDYMSGQLTVPQEDAIWARTDMAANVLSLEAPSDGSTDWRSGPYFDEKGLGRTRAMADSAQQSMGRVFLKVANDIKDAAVIAASGFDGDWLDVAGTTMLQALQSIDPDSVNKLAFLAAISGNKVLMGGVLASAASKAVPIGRPEQSLESAVEAAAPTVSIPREGDFDEARDGPQPGGNPGEFSAAINNRQVVDFVRARMIENGADPDVEVTDLDISAHEDAIKAAGLKFQWDEAPPPADVLEESLQYQVPHQGKVFSAHGIRRAGMHHGLDFAGEVGSHVGAVAAGRVSHIQSRAQWEKTKPGSGAFRAGAYIEVTHPDGRVSRYLHLDQVASDLKVGSQVIRGDRLGTLGGTGIVHDKPHLHFELREPDPKGGRYGESIDPKEIIEGL